MRFVLGLLFFTPAFAQTPDAGALLTRSVDELHRFRTYQVTQDTSMDLSMPGMSMPAIAYTTVTQAVNPGKIRMEMKMAGVDGMTLVSDGANTWMYIAVLKQYSKMTADADGAQEMMDAMGMSVIPNIKEMAANAKVIRSEILEVDGQQRDCWVVESRMDKLPSGAQGGAETQDVVFTSWIDKTLGLQLKESFAGKTKANADSPAVATKMTTTTRSMKFNEVLPDSVFVFTPPAGAKETKELFPGMGAVAGEAAAGPKPEESKPPVFGEPEAFLPNLTPLHRIEPVYPAEARSKGLQGMVNLLVTIDPDGTVVSAEPLSGRELLRPAAVDAVKQWKFRPVLRDGHPVFASTEAMVNFWLDTGKPGSSDDLGMAEQLKAAQRIQELTARFPRSREQTLADSEEQITGVDEMTRFYALADLAKQAFAVGALDKASSYAIELLKMANGQRNDWNYGNAIYNGNMVLGQIGLRQGNLSQARLYLLESGKTPGSPQLDSFGPDFTLARDLLAKGERDAVQEFLTLCRGFWKLGAEKIDAMSAAVGRGESF